MRNRVGVLALLFVAGFSTTVSAQSPLAGDVDQDRRLTTRDAVTIFESSGAPELARLHVIRAACDYNHDGACSTDDAYAVLAAVVTDFADVDGDGVANGEDCSPFDDRLSAPHTYYLDMDRDSFGSSTNTVEACVLAPPVPAVAWGGDPSDDTPFELLRAMPKGGRTLGLDFLGGPQDGAWRADLAREIGVDAAPIRLAWGDIERSPGHFDGQGVAVLDAVNAAFPAAGFAVSLTINPTPSAMPADLKQAVETGQLRYSDPAVLDRFKALLTFVHSRLPAVPPQSLQIGHEIDRFLVLAPQYFWGDYGVFFAAASAQAKLLWGSGLPVAMTASHPGLLNEPTRSLMRSLNALADRVSLTYLPRQADGRAVDPSSVRADVERVIALYYPKSIAFDTVGYPSSPLLGGSTTRQSQFLRAFFEVWDQYAPLIPFASFVRLHDYSFELAHFEALGAGGDLRREVAFRQSLGLRTWDGSGVHKPAYQTLRDLAFERGWWRVPPAATRRFGLGFTPALYDFPRTAGEYGEMLNWLQSTIQADATTVNLHLDHGVPWVEAFNDTWESPELPYSDAMKALWASMRSRVPAGKHLVVSINPLGVPRNVIAPYFGVGEGFTYDSSFRRIGNGVIADGENRLPPAPWNDYPLNHPDVKQAFLNYARRAVQYFAPDQLILAIEITATMNENPAAYDQLLDLLHHLYTHLKFAPATAALPLGVSISATTFMTDEYGVSHKHEDQPRFKRELQVQGLVDVLPMVDFIGLSLYPHYGKYNASTMPASMFDALMPLLEATHKPIIVSETGWPAETFTVLNVPFFSDAEKQERYYRLLFYEMTKTSADVQQIVSFAPRDSDRGWQRLVAASQQDPPAVSAQFVEFYKYFRDIGLYDGEGGVRPATLTWKTELQLPHAP